MTTLSGTDFNNKYPNIEFYKVLTIDCKHNDFTYQHGLNVDHIPFNPTGKCSAGGLYFTELDYLPSWISNTAMCIYIAKVTIPSDASVYVEQNQFKADQFVLDLDNKVLIKDFYIWKNEALCKIAVHQSSYSLQYVITQTDEICKLAVSKNGNALEYVKDQNDEICKLAINKNAYALQYVKNQNDEICKLAVSRKGYALEFVEVQTDEICKLAVSQNGNALEYVRNQNGRNIHTYY